MSILLVVLDTMTMFSHYFGSARHTMNMFSHSFGSARHNDPEVIIEIKIRKGGSDRGQLKRYVQGMNNHLTVGVLVYFLESSVDCIWQD